MKIAIAGAGAMGSLFASYLASIVEDLWVYDIWREHIDKIKSEGLRVTRQGEDRWVRLKATVDPHDVGIVDLLIIFVKYIHTSQAIRDSEPMIGDGTMVLTLQNGIGNVDLINKVIPSEQILFGFTTLPCEFIGPGHIEDSRLGKGETHFWPYNDQSIEQSQKICSIFNKAGIQSELSLEIERIIWEKLVVMCSYATLAAITRLRLGDFIDLDETKIIIKGIVTEIVNIAQKKGIALDQEQTEKFLDQVAEEGRNHIPSVLADVLKKRKTEIECLNGAVIKEGRRMGIPTPFNIVLFNLVRSLEQTYEKRL
jgi:2-dehydropantoate 2-reductase